METFDTILATLSVALFVFTIALHRRDLKAKSREH